MHIAINEAPSTLTFRDDSEYVPTYVTIEGKLFANAANFTLALASDIDEVPVPDTVTRVIYNGVGYIRTPVDEELRDKLTELRDLNEALVDSNSALADSIDLLRRKLKEKEARELQLLEANNRLHLKLTRDRTGEIAVPAVLMRDLDHHLGVWNATLGQGLEDTKFAQLQNRVRGLL